MLGRETAGNRQRAAGSEAPVSRRQLPAEHEGLPVDRHEFTVDAESAGLRLDVYLAGLLPQHSRSQLQRLIREGRVTVGGAPRQAEPGGQAGPARGRRGARARAGDAPAPGPAAPDRLPGRGRHRGQQAGRDGRAPGRRPPRGHAGQRAALPRRGPERRRRRAAAGDRAPARSRHVGADGGGQERPGAPRADAPVPRSRGREGVRRARVGRGARGPAHRPADRARPGAPREDVDARAPGPDAR